MCDETDLARWAKSGLSRRQFAAMGVAAGVAACTPMAQAEGEKAGLTEQSVAITTPDGTMDAFFVHPGNGRHPAVIVWPDIAGLRDAFKAMARRLAASGYAVIVANPYYRDLPAPQFTDFADFAGKGGFQMVGPWRGRLDADTVARDTASLVGWLDAQAAVDTARGIGTQGYCMGGPFTVWSTAAVPARVKAAASFHGGGLVGDAEKAPVKLLGLTQASYLIAIAQDDDAKSPADKDVLRQAADAAGRPAEIDVYAANHGWTVPDAPSYAEAEAERAWGRLLALYEGAL